MKKLIIIFGSVLFYLGTFATPSTYGFTGVIDYPTAYNLRINNYSVSAVMDNIENDSSFGVMFQGGFIPQIEAGINLSTDDDIVNEELMKSNFKFQFVQEDDNPAMAIGFVEANEMYGYLTASKTFIGLLDKKINLGITGGIKYSAEKSVNFFSSIKLPVFQKITILTEFFSYDRNIKENDEEKVEKVSSYNLGGEFYTNDSIRTKVFWRSLDNSFGVTINYIGIYK